MDPKVMEAWLEDDFPFIKGWFLDSQAVHFQGGGFKHFSFSLRTFWGNTSQFDLRICFDWVETQPPTNFQGFPKLTRPLKRDYFNRKIQVPAVNFQGVVIYTTPFSLVASLPLADGGRYLAFMPASLAFSWAGFMTYPAIKGVARDEIFWCRWEGGRYERRSLNGTELFF